MLPKWVKEECHTEFNQKMFVSWETIQLLLSFANKINVNNNYISIKYHWCVYLISQHYQRKTMKNHKDDLKTVELVWETNFLYMDMII